VTRFYYHLVTDSSDAGAATIEQGVYTPRLGKLARFGRSLPSEPSALLGFSPNTNGETGADNPERQGLNSTILDGDRDPVNVFPLDPDNDKRRANNYSPMWDAHLSQWTDAAIESARRRAIRGFEDLGGLVRSGLVESFGGPPAGQPVRPRSLRDRAHHQLPGDRAAVRAGRERRRSEGSPAVIARAGARAAAARGGPLRRGRARGPSPSAVARVLAEPGHAGANPLT